jgi:hypothetical protein
MYLKTDDHRVIKRLVASVEEESKRLFADVPDVTVQVGGGVTNAIALNETMVHGKINNLLQISALVLIITSIALRSLVGGLLVLLPLATAALMNLGVMGWGGIWLTMGTAAISAMAVGIGADYAIYFIFRVREQLRLTGDLRESVAHALTTSGKAIAYVRDGRQRGIPLPDPLRLQAARAARRAGRSHHGRVQRRHPGVPAGGGAAHQAPVPDARGPPAARGAAVTSAAVDRPRRARRRPAQEHAVAAPDAPLLVRPGERHGQRGRDAVALFVDAPDDRLRSEPEAIRGCDGRARGLMGHDDVDVARADPAAGEQPLEHQGPAPDRHLVDPGALHVEEVVRGRRGRILGVLPGAAAAHLGHAGALGPGHHLEAEQGARLARGRGLEHRRPGPVAEQRGALGLVEVAPRVPSSEETMSTRR